MLPIRVLTEECKPVPDIPVNDGKLALGRLDAPTGGMQRI